MTATPPRRTWYSPRGVPLGPSAQERVDLDVLAALYEYESADGALPRPAADLVTEYAWSLGWRNPRMAHMECSGACYAREWFEADPACPMHGECLYRPVN